MCQIKKTSHEDGESLGFSYRKDENETDVTTLENSGVLSYPVKHALTV